MIRRKKMENTIKQLTIENRALKRELDHVKKELAIAEAKLTRSKITKDIEEKIVEMKKDGAMTKDIAKSVNLSTRTIYNVLARRKRKLST